MSSQMKNEDYNALLLQTIDNMLAEIPADNESLIAGLQSARQSAEFSAPELMNIRWGNVADKLEGHIGKPTEDWHFAIQRIWTENCAIEIATRYYKAGSQLKHLESGILGTIVENYKLPGDVCVKWDNGLESSYDIEFLNAHCEKI